MHMCDSYYNYKPLLKSCRIPWINIPKPRRIYIDHSVFKYLEEYLVKLWNGVYIDYPIFKYPWQKIQVGADQPRQCLLLSTHECKCRSFPRINRCGETHPNIYVRDLRGLKSFRDKKFRSEYRMNYCNKR